MSSPWDYVIAKDKAPGEVRPVEEVTRSAIKLLHEGLGYLAVYESLPMDDEPLAGLARWLQIVTNSRPATRSIKAQDLQNRLFSAWPEDGDPATGATLSINEAAEIYRSGNSETFIPLEAWELGVREAVGPEQRITLEYLSSLKLFDDLTAHEVFEAFIDHTATAKWRHTSPGTRVRLSERRSDGTSTQSEAFRSIGLAQARPVLDELAPIVRAIANDLLLTSNRGPDRKVPLKPAARWRGADIGFVLHHIIRNGGTTGRPISRNARSTLSAVLAHPVRDRFLRYPPEQSGTNFRKISERVTKFWQKQLDQIAQDKPHLADAATNAIAILNDASSGEAL